MAYNLTNLTESNNLAEMLVSVDALSGNILGILLLLVVWIVVFMGVQDVNRVKAATASFITSIMTGILLIMGVVPNGVVWIVGFVLALTMVVLYVNPRD